jgi:hypothetical protein
MNQGGQGTSIKDGNGQNARGYQCRVPAPTSQISCPCPRPHLPPAILCPCPLSVGMSCPWACPCARIAAMPLPLGASGRHCRHPWRVACICAHGEPSTNAAVAVVGSRLRMRPPLQRAAADLRSKRSMREAACSSVHDSMEWRAEGCRLLLQSCSDESLA